MIETPMDILHQFPVRKSRHQKQMFRDAVQSYTTGLGYGCKIENGNIVIGDPETARFLIASHYRSTSGVVTLLETAVSMPRNLRERVCFVLFDGKRRGASFHYRKHQYASDLQTVLYLDRVGEESNIALIPNKSLKADEDQLNRLIELERRCGEKRVLVREIGKNLRFAGSLPFLRSVSICTMHQNKFCCYASAAPDPHPDYTNVNILRACLITYIGGVSDE